MSPQKLIKKIDGFQQRHKVTSFGYAVIKKYGEDTGGYQSALITYYGVLSLFPLLIVLTSITKLIFRSNEMLRSQISHSITRYFPVVGQQVQSQIHDPAKTGLLLFITLLITLYGARGVASALQYTLSSVWHIPPVKRPNLVKNLSRSLAIIGLGGLGLILASVISGFAVRLGNYPWLKLLGIAISVVVIWVMLIAIMKLAVAGHKKVSDIWRGAAFAAIGIEILQLIGNVILSHELRSLNTTYGTFALVIGLMFWVFLQAQILVYGTEIDVVRHFKLYPRSFSEPIIEPDKKAYQKYAKAERRHDQEKIGVKFKQK